MCCFWDHFPKLCLPLSQSGWSLLVRGVHHMTFYVGHIILNILYLWMSNIQRFYMNITNGINPSSSILHFSVYGTPTSIHHMKFYVGHIILYVYGWKIY